MDAARYFSESRHLADRITTELCAIQKPEAPKKL
jgi:hypothetical protein